MRNLGNSTSATHRVKLLAWHALQTAESCKARVGTRKLHPTYGSYVHCCAVDEPQHNHIACRSTLREWCTLKHSWVLALRDLPPRFLIAFPVTWVSMSSNTSSGCARLVTCTRAVLCCIAKQLSQQASTVRVPLQARTMYWKQFRTFFGASGSSFAPATFWSQTPKRMGRIPVLQGACTRIHNPCQ